MQNVRRVLQPKSFERFRCIGADCEDTCCAGWGILVDRETYEKYQHLPAHLIAGRPLSDLVEINPAGSSSKDYAKFRLDEAGCPALDGGLCSIQRTLGEPWIPDLCSTYPRVLTEVGGVLQKSVHLSCPEAARLVLHDPDAMVFHEGREEGQPDRAGSVSAVAGDLDDRLYRVQALIIETIRERSLPLWQRIVSLGFAMDRLAGVDVNGDMTAAIAVLEDHVGSLRRGALDDNFAALKADSAFQLEAVLELIVARIGSDYTSPRFLECYRDFMQGLSWTAASTMEELADRSNVAFRTWLLPFTRRHEHLLENYLINYIFRTVFPYRSRLPDQKFAIDTSRASLRRSFVLLSVHYAIVRTVLIGMAAFYKDNLSIDHAVKLVQSYSKAFLHSTSFEAAAIEYLEKNTGDAARRVPELVMD